jgi:hypothetical protein
MVNFSDEQLAAIQSAAAPLSPADRSRFLEVIAVRLNGKDLGDGVVYHAIRDTQREFLKPPVTGFQPEVRRSSTL